MSSLIKKFKTLMFNPAYTQGSLYGAGLFPCWLYIKYFGKPMYVRARRLGCNKYFSLMAANILGSGFHVDWFNNGWEDVIPFIASLIIFTTFMTITRKFIYNRNIFT
jgi:hypothetical protein